MATLQSANSRPTTRADITELIQNIRQEDREEIEGLGHSVLALHLSLEVSENVTSMVAPDGSIAGVAGLVDMGNRVGEIWMVCTKVIEKNPIALIKGAKWWLPQVSQNYDILYNSVSKDNLVHRRLLKKLGFRGLRYVQPAPYYKPYIEFVKLCAYS